LGESESRTKRHKAALRAADDLLASIPEGSSMTISGPGLKPVTVKGKGKKKAPK
jgi:hypothetical protein